METQNSNYRFILLRGLEDLPNIVSESLCKLLNIESFNSDWIKEESFESKVVRLNETVQKFIKENHKIIFLGVSAGAGLAESYILSFPKQDIYVFSLLGVLDPNPNDPQMKILAKKSKSFSEMINFLENNLTPSRIDKYRLGEKIIAYSSDGDNVVPLYISSPEWVMDRKIVGHANHVQTILSLLMTKIPQLINILEK